MKHLIYDIYRSIYAYLRARAAWCLLMMLIIVELFIHACLHTAPSDGYAQYLVEINGRYCNEFWLIFCENCKGALGMIACGSIPFGAGVFVYAYLSMRGLVSTGKFLLQEISGLQLFLCTLPHGIFEIPEICFSMLLATLWCRAVTMAVIRICRGKPIWRQLCNDLDFLWKSICFLLIPMLLVAAAAESTISACMVDWTKTVLW